MEPLWNGHCWDQYFCPSCWLVINHAHSLLWLAVMEQEYRWQFSDCWFEVYCLYSFWAGSREQFRCMQQNTTGSVAILTGLHSALELVQLFLTCTIFYMVNVCVHVIDLHHSHSMAGGHLRWIQQWRPQATIRISSKGIRESNSPDQLWRKLPRRTIGSRMVNVCMYGSTSA